jgi:hypothetical protein
MILPLGELPSRSSVTSSFDSGESARALTEIIKPANTSRTTPVTIFFPRLKSDFIAGYPSLFTLPKNEEASY